LARRHGVEDEVQYVDVPCVTFEDLIEEYNIRSVDLLIIDVEGQEWELLQAAFQAGLAPAIVFMEFLHLPPGDRLRAEAFLARRGYDIAYSGIDLIGLQPFRASRDRSVTTGSRPRTIS